MKAWFVNPSYGERSGQQVIVGHSDDGTEMVRIRFEDGFKSWAYPDELTPVA